MTDTSPDFQSYEAKLAAFDALRAEILPDNKAILFDLLAAARIQTVVVAFDGSGDSGQIEEVTAFGADSVPIPLPGTAVGVHKVDYDGPGVTIEMRTAGEMVEEMAYDLLHQTYGNWEDNDGAYGEFSFSVAERSIELEYNERYTASSYHCHSF